MIELYPIRPRHSRDLALGSDPVRDCAGPKQEPTSGGTGIFRPCRTSRVLVLAEARMLSQNLQRSSSEDVAGDVQRVPVPRLANTGTLR
jgi:hypothetical protein